MGLSYSFSELLSRKGLMKSERINGCGVLVVKDGKILTGTRIGGKHANQICGPGGHIEYGESHEDAAIRESYEEFGIECKKLKSLGILDGGRNYGKSAVFLCTEYDGEPKTDEEEMTDCRWRTIEELRNERLFYPFEQALEFLKTIEKFNPYHDSKGRFASADGASSFTFRTKDPAKQHMADRAMEREKERQSAQALAPSVAQEKTLGQIANRTRNLKKEQLSVVDSDGNVVMHVKGNRGEVNFTVGEARDNFPGNITIHNHPDGGTFSAADLTSLGYGAKEIRVASPEGDYILKATKTHKSGNPDTSGWYDMRNSLEDAETSSFKSHYAIKKEAKAKYQPDYDEKVGIFAKKWGEARDRGASQEEQQKYIDAYNKANKAWEEETRPKIEKEIRNITVKQYHDFYTENASKYGLDYQFIPKEVKKGIFMIDGYTEDIIGKSASDGEISLDKDFNDKISSLTDEILDEIRGDIQTPNNHQ